MLILSVNLNECVSMVFVLCTNSHIHTYILFSQRSSYNVTSTTKKFPRKCAKEPSDAAAAVLLYMKAKKNSCLWTTS